MRTGSLLPGRVHHVDLEVLEPQLVRGEQDVLAGDVHVRRPAHRLEVGDLLGVGAVGVHRPDVGDEPLLVEAAPQDLLAVGGEERAAVVAGGRGEPPLAAAVGLHDVDLGEPAGVGRQLFLLGLRQRMVIARARRREHDPLPVGRVPGFGVVAAHVGQPGQRLGALGVGVDLHLRVVVPGVAAFLARGAERQLVVLLLLRRRIVVRRGEEDLIGAGTEEPARGLAQAGRDARGVAGRQVHHVLLVEGVARLALALQHQPLAVGRPVPFAGPPAFDREPADARHEVALLVGRALGRDADGGDGQGEGGERGSGHPAILPTRRGPVPGSPSIRLSSPGAARRRPPVGR